MLVRSVSTVLDRDLRALAREVETYSDERDLWRLAPGVSNSGGTLALHLAGNVQHYFGACLAGTGYRRDRPAEFADRDVPRTEIVRRIEAAREALHAAAEAVDESTLEAEFPEVVGGVRVATGEYLIHLLGHFAYHLGQLDYHRRLVTGDDRGVDAIRAAELGSARPVAD
ncbi:MAG: DinB family protein [Gemmatimonadales bacterium]|nr:DinB family protein [Gemmatimonadales bacterium]